MDRREALKALVSLPAVARISVAELKPDDVIVMECDGPVSAEAVKRIKETTEAVWPGRKVVVLSDGLSMKVVSGGKIP